MAVDLVGIQALDHLNRIFQHDFSASSSFKQAVSAFNRSGHARFRRAPPFTSADTQTPSVSSRSEEKLANDLNKCSLKKTVTSVANTTASFQSVCSRSEESKDWLLKKSDEKLSSDLMNNCLLKKSVTESVTSSFSFSGGSVSVDGSVSNGRQLSSLGIVAPAPSFSSRKPPLPSSHRKRNSANITSGRDQNHSVSRTACHCCKRRKTGSKREVRRIPIIGSKVESIPADDYSWKKYGEKKANGSRFPRVYYKCNSVKGCPARKRVELAVTDSKMLVVTYDGEHRH